MRKGNSTALETDRYHDVMAEYGLNIDPAEINIAFGNIEGTWYLTQRGIPYAPLLGHSEVIDLLNRSRADESRARFLEEDRAGSGLRTVAERLRRSRFPGTVELMPEGTIFFAREPVGIITGPFSMTQVFENVFKRSFNFRTTIAYKAMKMREAVGDNIFISDFTLRTAGEHALDAAEALFVGGFADTSNMEAAFLDGIVSVGTMAHYLTQAFVAYVEHNVKEANQGLRNIPQSWYENGRMKHPQRIFIDSWLDFHPKGTTVTVDTYSVKLGMIHFVESVLSSSKRKKAGKVVRIDSGNLVKGVIFAREILDVNGLHKVKILLSGDLDDEKIAEIKKGLRDYCLKNRVIKDKENFNPLEEMGVTGVAGGTKFIYMPKDAGFIFKLINFWTEPSLKCSDTPGKETIPGDPSLQVWRCENENRKYIGDVIGLSREQPPEITGVIKCVKSTPLIQSFWQQGMSPELKTVHELKAFVKEQKKRFIVLLEEYGEKRIYYTLALNELAEILKTRYLKEPTTNIRVTEWPE